jgi:aryl-alcohol dehydrogenase-like predicted oxidoreductase
MQLRTLGKTGLQISELGFGCASFWGKKIFSEREAIRLVHAAIDHGVSYFDTAPSYSGGNAEPRLGRALAGMYNRREIVISTKIGSHTDRLGRPYGDFRPIAVRRSVEQSLKQLNLDTIPILLLHGPDFREFGTEGLLEELARLKQEGKFRHLGLNSFEMDVVEHVMTLPQFEVAMIDYNLLKPERADIIDRLSERQIGLLAGRPLAGGVFSKAKSSLRIRDAWYVLRAWRHHRADAVSARDFEFIKNVEGWTGNQIALAWVLANPKIHSAVFGSTRMWHLMENLAASGRRLDSGVIKKITEVHARTAQRRVGTPV